MPSQRIKLRRGTTAQQQNFTGAEGEVTFDTDKNTLVVHDGTTKGGHVLPRDTDVKTDIGQLTDAYGILQSYVDGFSGTTETYTITVAAASSGGGNVFYITGLENPHIVLTPGNRYIFDVSDSSNTGHPLYFTADDGVTNYTTNVSRIGTEGTAGAKVIFIIPADVPALKYYCSVHGLSMGNQISSVLNTQSSGGGGSVTAENSIEFNAGKYLSISSGDADGIFGPDGWSVDFWYKKDASTTSGGTGSFQDGIINQHGHFVIFDNTNQGVSTLTIAGSQDNTGSNFWSANTSTVTTTNWNHFHVGYDGTTVRVFVNGTLDNSVVTTSFHGPVTGGTAPLNVGARSGGVGSAITEVLAGQLADVHIQTGTGGVQTTNFSIPTSTPSWTNDSVFLLYGSSSGWQNATSTTVTEAGTGNAVTTNTLPYSSGGGSSSLASFDISPALPTGETSWNLATDGDLSITEAGNWTFTATVDGTVDLSMKGAGGGYGKDTNALGGAGGLTSGKIAVTAGDVFKVTVGSKGVQSGGAGAYGGGGAGGNLTLPGSGGGYSGIFEGTEQQSKSILIAGGGGGGHGWDAGSATGNGGSGGGADGLAGTAGSSGGGATQISGGAGAGNGTSGTPLTGGTGGTRSTNQGSGGGGGGGYFGGGGGAAGSYNGNQNGTPGGGGSGYIGGTSNFAVTDGVTTAGSGSTTEVDGTFSMVGQVAATEETPTTSTTYNILSNSSNTGLLITTDGEAGVNSSFVDSSSNAATITAGGTPQLNTFSPYRHGGYSTYFDGNGDYLSMPSVEGYKFGTGDFTIEGWVYFNTLNDSVWQTVIDCWQGTNNYNWLLVFKADTLAFAAGNNGAYSASNNHQVAISPLSAGNWYHFAATRESGSLRFFINGIQQGSTLSSTANISDNIPVYIGTNQDGGQSPFNGHLSDIRVVKGTAVYTADFTPPTERLTAITGTELLTCHLPYIVDESTNNNAITKNGDVSIEPLSPYDHIGYIEGTHGGSVYFDGVDDYLVLPANTGYEFGTGDFTVEAWINTDLSSFFSFWQNSPVTGSAGSDRYFMSVATDGSVYFYQHGPGSPGFKTPAGVVSQNTWAHVAIVRNSGTSYIYVNGVEQASSSVFSTTDFNLSTIHTIGYTVTPFYGRGYISDLRVVKGTAVYTADFTPPVTLLESTNAALHIKGVEGHIIDKAQSGNNFTLVGDITASTSETKYAGSSISLDGTGDHIQLENTPEIDVSTGDFTWEGWFNWNDISNNPKIFISGGSATAYWQLYVYSSKLTLRVNSSQIVYGVDTTNISTNQWYHIALVRSGDTFTVYKDGVSVITDTYAGSIGHHSDNGIGGQNSYPASSMNGYMEDVRLSKFARYTEDFTVPNAALEAPQVIQSEGSYTVATGGTITTDGNYKYHIFTEDGTFSVTGLGTNTTIDVLAVGGGGGGGGSSDSNSGGGGAGGYLEGSITAEVQSYDIVIGQGGTGGVADVGTSGGDTTISVLNATALGGGYGGGGARSLQKAAAQGGSGGGGGGFPNDMSGGAGIQGDSGGLTGYGNAGGSVGSYSSDGGGGAGQAGGTNANSAGGDGRQWLDGNYYAGGGSGGAGNLAGGLGGGGAGSNGSGNGANATANTGGGGGGSYAAGSSSSSTGGNGGSGVVIFRYQYQGTVTETAPTSTSYRYMKVVLNSVSSGTQAQVTEISFTGENGATDFITGQTITNWYGTGSTATSQSPTIALVNNAQSPQNSEHTNLDTLPFTLEYDLGASYVYGTELRYLQLGSSDSDYRYPTSVTVYGATQPDFSDEVALITNSAQAYTSVNSNTLIDLGN